MGTRGGARVAIGNAAFTRDSRARSVLLALALVACGFASAAAGAADAPDPRAPTGGADVAATDPACIGSYVLADGRGLDIARSDATGYRWRMEDGTSGRLEHAQGSQWTSTLGWTGRADGHRVDFIDCAVGRLAFDGIEGERLALPTMETRFEVAGATLAGRLLLPPGDAVVPIVVLVHGSEDTSALEHYALQRQFPAAGIGAFVYDKRGTGASTGRFTHDYLILANDAIAAANEARRLAGARAGRLGYQGSSQGGWVAPLAAAIEPVDFVVVAYGLAVSPLDEDREAIALDMARHGHGPDALRGAMEVADATAEVLLSGFREGYDRLAEVKRRYGQDPWFSDLRGNISFFVLENDEATLRETGPPLLPGVPMHYDPMPVLRNLEVPQLWLLGGEDIDAPPGETVRRLSGLIERGAPIRLEVFPDAEHGMYEFELAADGSRLSTRQPAGYFPRMRAFILGDDVSTADANSVTAGPPRGTSAGD